MRCTLELLMGFAYALSSLSRPSSISPLSYDTTPHRALARHGARARLYGHWNYHFFAALISCRHLTFPTLGPATGVLFGGCSSIALGSA